MNEESKLIELFKKYPEYNQELKHQQDSKPQYQTYEKEIQEPSIHTSPG